MKKKLIDRAKGTDGKYILGTDKVTPLNNLEQNALYDLDRDKIKILAHCLFRLNNSKYGPIHGAYIVMCTKPDKEWCVGQLNSDGEKPFILFEDKVFSSAEDAQKEAEKIKKNRGETMPVRNH